MVALWHVFCYNVYQNGGGCYMADNNSKRVTVPIGERHAQAIAQALEKQSLPNYTKNKVSQYLSEPNVKTFNKILLDKAFSKHIPISDSEELTKELSDYFSSCYSFEIVPTMSSLAVWLGVNIDTIYANMQNGCKNSEILKQAVNFCHSINENGAISGSINSVLYMFLSKNYYGMHDNSTINLTTGLNEPTINNANTMKVIQEQLALENNAKTNSNMSNSDET